MVLVSRTVRIQSTMLRATARAWKSLAACLGIATYLLVFVQQNRAPLAENFVTRSGENDPETARHLAGSRGSGGHRTDARGRGLEAPSTLAVSGVREGQGGADKLGRGEPDQETRRGGNERQLASPLGYMSQNNSLKPIFARRTVNQLDGGWQTRQTGRKRLLNVDKIRRNSMKPTEIIVTPSLPSLHGGTTIRRESDLKGDSFNREPSPEGPFHDVNCDVSNRRRRLSQVCRHSQNAGHVRECDAPLVICQPQLCHFDVDDVKGRPQPYLLVLIHSHPSHHYQRDAIRDTWGAIVRDYTLEKRVVFVFVLGSASSDQQTQQVSREAALYRDMVQYEVEDTYGGLAVKSVLALDWVNTFCRQAAYVLKTDDDAFMNISNILRYLDSQPRRRRLLLGSMHESSAVQRHGQWKVGREVYPDPTYPPYCAGTAYVMSSDVVTAIHHAHYHSRSRDAVLVPMEDVYVTGVLAARAGVACENSKSFPNWTTGPSPKVVQLFLQGHVLGMHGLSPSGMYGLHKLVRQCAACRQSASTLRKWFALLTGDT